MPIPVASPPPAALPGLAMHHRIERFPRSFLFGSFLLQPERQQLLKEGTPVRIGGRALDLLTALVERPGELVSKQELVSRAWPSTFVDQSNLKVNIANLRRVLGEAPTDPQFIATVVGRGYRFIAPVRSSGTVAAPPRENEYRSPAAAGELTRDPSSAPRRPSIRPAYSFTFTIPADGMAEPHG